jgi:hypothetical protein
VMCLITHKTIISMYYTAVYNKKLVFYAIKVVI